MNYLHYLFSIIFIQQTAAQILTVAGNNFIPNLYNPNIGSNIPLTAGLGLGNGIALANVGQTGKVDLANTQRNTPNGNIGSTNLDNFYIPNGIANQAFANSNTIGSANSAANNYANIGLANNAARNNANVAKVDIANANAPCSNNANVGSNYANVVKPPRDYGIEFGADALEVNGNVQVSGRMPFRSNVAVQGSMPAQGQGTVSYKCDKVSSDDS